MIHYVKLSDTTETICGIRLVSLTPTQSTHKLADVTCDKCAGMAAEYRKTIDLLRKEAVKEFEKQAAKAERHRAKRLSQKPSRKLTKRRY
jgi:hypothetical protein